MPIARLRNPIRNSLAIVLALAVGACAPVVIPAGPIAGPARLVDGHLLASDGARLPVRRWLPAGKPRAVILGLHGFNDYSRAFEAPAAYWAERGIATYAYDQRGFGAAPNPGIWAGTGTLVGDVHAMSETIRRGHPGVPLYLVGVSMGGAVALLATAGHEKPIADGTVLVAPAVWGGAHMGTFQRATLWLFAHTVPWFPLTGEGLRIKPSDNIEMLRALGRDPLVLKQTRVDSIYGLVGMMDAALAATRNLTTRALVLYGRRDEIIPEDPTVEMLKTLTGNGGDVRAAVYAGGYHMLLRGLKADNVLADIVAWIKDSNAALPSGADAEAIKLISRDR